jgi:hypothetical protein
MFVATVHRALPTMVDTHWQIARTRSGPADVYQTSTDPDHATLAMRVTMAAAHSRNPMRNAQTGNFLRIRPGRMIHLLLRLCPDTLDLKGESAWQVW